MRPKRDFRPALLEELKHFNRCTKKSKNPSHFCTQKELANNLQMSLRDVGKALHSMTTEGLLNHDKSKQNGRLQDTFIPTNDRLYESKEMLLDTEKIIESKVAHIRELAVKMRDRPAIKSIKNMLPVLDDRKVVYNTRFISKARSYTGKIDKIGQNHLDQFCQDVNLIFSYLDSMGYATCDDSIEANDMTDKVIKNLRINFCNELTEILEYTFKPHSARLSHAIMEQIRMKIPTYFLIGQYQKMSRVKI